MQIELTAEQRDFIRRATATGRVRHPEDAVREALELWMERERKREEILAALDEAEASLAHGQGIIITAASMRELADDVKRSGRARLAEQKSRR